MAFGLFGLAAFLCGLLFYYIAKMPGCSEKKCCCESMCSLFGCILKHEAFNGKEKEVHFAINSEPEYFKEKIVIELISKKIKLKVRGRDVGRYFNSLNKTGVDPDKDSSFKKKKKRVGSHIAPRLSKRKMITEKFMRDYYYPGRIETAEQALARCQRNR